MSSGATAPVTGGGDGDVQWMGNSEGVRFSMDSEGRERRGRAWRPGELRELRRRYELEAVAPVLPGRPKHVKQILNNEG